MEEINHMMELDDGQRQAEMHFQQQMDDKLTDQDRMDKARIGGNHLNFKDPNNDDKKSGFHVMVSGHIESG